SDRCLKHAEGTTMHALMVALALAGVIPDPIGTPVTLPDTVSTGRTAAAAVMLSGRVTNADGPPLAAVRATVGETSRTTTTSADGTWSLAGHSRGTHGMSFAGIGYAPEVLRVRLGDQDTTINVVRRPAYVELPDIQVTASPLATTALEAPLPISV